MHIADDTFYRPGPSCGKEDVQRCDDMPDALTTTDDRDKQGAIKFEPESPPKYRKNNVCVHLKFGHSGVFLFCRTAYSIRPESSYHIK